MCFYEKASFFVSRQCFSIVLTYSSDFLAEKRCRTNVKLPQKASFGTKTAIVTPQINPTSPLGWGGLGLGLFQSSNWEGLPFPLPPSLGCGSRGSRSVIGHLSGARFGPPFFHHLGPPKIVITNYFGARTIPFWDQSGFQNRLPFRDWLFLFFLSIL